MAVSKNYFKALVAILCFSAFSIKITAEVKLPPIISDNMVLQANAPIHIWGKANAGENVVVSLLNQTRQAVADANGDWQLWLDPVKPARNLELRVNAQNAIVVKNVLVGDVWHASGQSNMEWDVSQSVNADKAIAEANYNDIRFFDAKRSFSDTVVSEIEGNWVVCNSETVKKITAAGYYFVLDLYKRYKKPMGLIDTSWGATRCEAWTPEYALKADSRLSYYYESMTKPAKNKAKPSSIFNGVVKPLSKYTIKGTIWYQGENNAYKDEAYNYRYMFPAMIQSWRKEWGQGDFPFIFVQLSILWKHPFWPVLRESQTESLKLNNTAMVVTYDIGDSTDAHYKNKPIVGSRLALAARKLVYGENIVASGPQFKQVTKEGNSLRIWFDNAKGLKAVDGLRLRDFQIAGQDGVYYIADAIINGETVLLSHPAVSRPCNAKYAFKDVTLGNLINAAGLPAVPFRTDIKNGL